MRYPQREGAQRTFRFEPQVRIELPHGARQEAVAVLAALIAAVMGDVNQAADEAGRDE